ncbi:MAG: HAD-IC family P-type ATPase [Acidimicrobiales bacterium]
MDQAFGHEPTTTSGGNPTGEGTDTGLSDAEVAERLADGRSNRTTPPRGRTVSDIVRANVLTRFNAILTALLVVVIVIGPPKDGLFGLVMVANSAIGVIQEVRAKRTLDRFRVITAPVARVRRAGESRTVPVDQVVLDDVVEIASGEQVIVDGTVLSGGNIEADESLLTGESQPVAKAEGDELLSGSFAVSGQARYRAIRVGDASFVSALGSTAGRFAPVVSEIRGGTDRILRWVTWALVPTATLLVISQLRAGGLPTHDALRGAVAGMVAMVPEGLVLLTSMAFALGVIRLGRRRVLVQQLPAIEVLARVDVVCVDKTGTLTEGGLKLSEVVSLGPERDEIADGLAAVAGADTRPNPTLSAIGAAFARPLDWTLEASVPFSSARRWSGADFGARGTWVLGAPDVVAADIAASSDGTDGADGTRAADLVNRYAGAGHRVVMLARGTALETGQPQGHPPHGLTPVALAVLDQPVRPDASTTVTYFADQGVTVKVLSGDHPTTVGAVASRVGIGTGAPAVDASRLPEDGSELADAVAASDVFGRVGPDQKRMIVGALQDQGHVVAMVGDGVNDVRALKAADVGVAMGSGSDATRAVAELVLLDDSFAALPHVVREGRMVIANVERVANLFVTKTVYALLLALAVGVATLPFPFLPRQLTLVGALTIGIPSFFLAFSQRAPRARPGFVRRVLRFAVPAGTCAAAATFAAYALGRLAPDVSTDEARTTATMVLLAVGLALVTRLARPLTVRRVLLIVSLGSAYLVALFVGPFRDFFSLNDPPPIVILAALGAASMAMWVFDYVQRLQGAAPARARRAS